jgi:TonB family protein
MLTFATLENSRPPVKEFMLTMAVQSLGLFLLTYVGLLSTGVLPVPSRAYRYIPLVATPAPVNVEPAPLKVFRAPQIARVIPAPEVRQTPRIETAPVAPRIEVATTKPVPLPPTVAVIPRELVKTNTFSTGSSAVPTIAAAPQHVQTGGFGDPNGVPAHNGGKPVNIAQAGGFDLPSGPGNGNGTGGAKGRQGVVASTGFGSGTATGDGSGKVSASRGTVKQTGFNDTAAAAVKVPVHDAAPSVVPAQIISKPTPQYTAEARTLKLEGAVILEVVFEASGHMRVVRVVQGLGHGLDESAIAAASQICFKPAKKDGQPSDYSAQIRIVFELAS